MAALKLNNLPSSSVASCSSLRHGKFYASLNPSGNIRSGNSYLPRFENSSTIKKLILGQEKPIANRSRNNPRTVTNKDELIAELLAIAEAAADRAEMHAIIGTQRNNWNHLLTSSINSITLMASLMAGISSIPVIGGAAPQLLPFKIASMVFFGAATGMMLIVNKIQPSQLAEEQRKSTQLWKQLEKSIRNSMKLKEITRFDVKYAMERVFALDKAYPLPLLPGMLEKFPQNVEPARWWPELKSEPKKLANVEETNGWSREMEAEMEGILRVLKLKDEEEYASVGKVVLSVNKAFATSGPILAGFAAMGAGFIGTPALGPIPVLAAVLGGSLAAMVNTLEHAGQLGMLFELMRNCAGYYRHMEEEIELNLGEVEVRKRENGELFRTKMALQLGRSLSELKDFAAYASPSCKDEEIKDFAGKIF